jgi:hypothetical protein
MTKDSVTNFSNLINACNDLKTNVSNVRDIWGSFRENNDCPSSDTYVSLVQIDYLLSDLENRLEILSKKRSVQL